MHHNEINFLLESDLFLVPNSNNLDYLGIVITFLMISGEIEVN